MPLPYQDYPKALTARFCPFYLYSTKGFLNFLQFFRHVSQRYRLISYTPAPSQAKKGLRESLTSCRRGYTKAMLAIRLWQAGRLYIHPQISQQVGKSQIPNFATPAAYRISTKNTMPAAWCISAPLLFQPPAGRKGTFDRLRLSEVLLRYFCQK